ncbi:MAG: cache domain-containing protein [Lentimicrobium sp.]
MFVEIVKTVQKSGSGYVEYMWLWKDDSLHIVPKLSYVRLFRPWNQDLY